MDFQAGIEIRDSIQIKIRMLSLISLISVKTDPYAVPNLDALSHAFRGLKPAALA